MRVLGLMSGTSADGVDAVLVNFEGRAQRPRWRLLNRASQPFPADLQQRLIQVGQGLPCTAAELLELGEALTEQQAIAARRCDPDGQAALVGCHGQTLWHRPPNPERRGSSWQLLHGPLLAQLLQRPVVFDFRAADLALGGQGAPLVPAADAALLPAIGGWRGLLNLGGIANITLLPPAVGPDRRRQQRDVGDAPQIEQAAPSTDGGQQRRIGRRHQWGPLAPEGQIGGAEVEHHRPLQQLGQQWPVQQLPTAAPPLRVGRPMPEGLAMAAHQRRLAVGITTPGGDRLLLRERFPQLQQLGGCAGQALAHLDQPLL